jgi:hypothetical protein
MAGEEGFEPSNAGIKIRCLDQLGDSPATARLRHQTSEARIIQVFFPKTNKTVSLSQAAYVFSSTDVAIRDFFCGVQRNSKGTKVQLQSKPEISSQPPGAERTPPGILID